MERHNPAMFQKKYIMLPYIAAPWILWVMEKNKSHVPKKTPDLLPSGSRNAAAKTRSFPGLGVDGRLWVWKGRTVVAPKSNGYQSGYLSLSIMENMGYLYVISIIFMNDVPEKD